jgi:hypothetical protein
VTLKTMEAVMKSQQTSPVAGCRSASLPLRSAATGERGLRACMLARSREVYGLEKLRGSGKTRPLTMRRT